ncbi:MAG: hypothetical protein FJ265_06420 [Planctomycetes bacterium]|nr:hypothetical protein [Planctomycetota bacterium]
MTPPFRPVRLLLGVLLGVLLGAAGLSAQHPAAGGDAAVWSSTEGGAYAELLRLAAGVRAERPLRMPPGGLRLRGYRVLLFAPDANGDVETARATAADAPWLLLAWPMERTEDAGRAVLLHHDGMAMFAELPAGDACEPGADHVTGKGSAGRFADVVRAPGTSTSSHLWLWMHQAGRPVRVAVVDDHGAPRTRCEVVLLPAASEASVPPVLLPGGAWPIGRAVVGANGAARVQGPRCRDLAVQILLQPHDRLAVTGFAALADGDGLRFVLGDAAIRRNVVLPNEAAAIATLRNLASAQAQCQASSVVDADGDGKGEFGYFGELSGRLAVRGADRRIDPPVLSAAFSRVVQGRVARSGYLFQLYLCDRDGKPLPELDQGGSPADVDADRAESHWCAYAWPVSPEAGERAFVVNQAGDVLACANEGCAYAGHERPPAPTAAFAPGGTGMLGALAADAEGQDRRRWTVAR